MKQTDTTTAREVAALVAYYDRLTGRFGAPRRIEPWLAELIQNALALYSLAHLKDYTDAALAHARRHSAKPPTIGRLYQLQRINAARDLEPTRRDPTNYAPYKRVPGVYLLPPIAHRAYLKVPFEDREAVKALGARWDAQARAWCVDTRNELAAFQPWLTQSANIAGDVQQAALMRRKAMENQVEFALWNDGTRLSKAEKAAAVEQLLRGQTWTQLAAEHDKKKARPKAGTVGAALTKLLQRKEQATAEEHRD